MHISEGVLSPAVLGAGAALAVSFIAKVRPEILQFSKE